jgi:hypothetical protein
MTKNISFKFICCESHKIIVKKIHSVSVKNEFILDYDKFLDIFERDSNFIHPYDCCKSISKSKVKKKKYVKKSSNAFDINNFIINERKVSRITQNTNFHEVPVPTFKELPQDYCMKLEEIEYESESESECLNEEVYLKTHSLFEKREHEQLNKFSNQKK